LHDERDEGDMSADEDRDAPYQIVQHLLARCRCLGSVHGHGGGGTGTPNAKFFAKGEVDEAEHQQHADNDAENASRARVISHKNLLPSNAALMNPQGLEAVPSRFGQNDDDD
jgi:hypothetical protein